MRTYPSERTYAKIIGEYPCLKIDRIEHAGHIKFYLSTPAGPQLFVAPRSSSDWRAERNNRSLFNNWSKGIDK